MSITLKIFRSKALVSEHTFYEMDACILAVASEAARHPHTDDVYGEAVTEKGAVAIIADGELEYV
jgi:hypothetical protein